jgi:hypothetical protein
MVQKRRTRIIRAPADLLEWCMNSEGSLIILNDKKGKEKKRTPLILGCLPCKCCSGVAVAK